MFISMATPFVEKKMKKRKKNKIDEKQRELKMLALLDYDCFWISTLFSSFDCVKGSTCAFE